MKTSRAIVGAALLGLASASCSTGQSATLGTSTTSAPTTAPTGTKYLITLYVPPPVQPPNALVLTLSNSKQRRFLLPDRLQHQLDQAFRRQPHRQPPAAGLDRQRRPELGRLPGLEAQHEPAPDLQLCLRRRHHIGRPRQALRADGPELRGPGQGVRRQRRREA